MGSGEWGWIVPDGLWEVVEPLLPAARVRQQGGGTAKVHVLSDRNGLPLVIGISSADTHDQHGLTPLVEVLPAKHDPERGPHLLPRKPHADKAYDNSELRTRLRRRGILPRIARKGVESSQTLGRHRWVIERTMSWLTGYRRIARRHERDHRQHLAFCDLAAAITCHKRLAATTLQG
ncbi:IS5 family transposase [Kitasatospora sp. NBC_00374]|uniref:IS5 family transposase n=1 Tax=Kitasatospora sp. NBC_00374 TaxID=2975964 RepID=UPI0030E5F586